jgi:hypothetical protein
MCNKVKFNNKGKEIAFIINNVWSYKNNNTPLRQTNLT